MALPALLLAGFRMAATMRGAAATQGALGSLLNARASGSGSAPAAGMFPATQQQFQQAAKHFGTSNPSAAQLQSLQSGSQQHPDRSLGATAKTIVAFTSPLVAATGALRDYTKHVEQAADRLRMFSPVVGQAAAQFEVNALRRTYRAAQATGGTTAALLRARSNRLDAIQPLSDAMTNLGNVVRVGWTNAQTFLFKFLSPMVQGISTIATWAAKKLGIEQPEEADENQFQAQFKGFLNRFGNLPEAPRPDDFRGGRGRL